MNATVQKSKPFGEDATNNQQGKESNRMGSLFSYASLSRLLRLIGASILVVAIYLFLFQGWQTANDIDRYIIMLAQTLGLSFAGFACSYWLNENKSARLLLGLSLFSVPVNFAILGGMLYSQFQWDAGLHSYPDFAHWTSDSLVTALVTTAIGWLLLMPVIFIGFMVLARQSATRLSLLFMLGSAAILLPVRDIEIISGLLVILTLIILRQTSAVTRHDLSLCTLEGRFARYMCFLPAGIILGRATFLYAVDAMMFTVIAGLFYGVFRQLAIEQAFSQKFRLIMEYLGGVTAGCVAIGLTILIDSYQSMPDEIFIFVFVFFLAGLMLEISFRACKGGAGYRRAAAMILSMGMFTNLLLFPSVVTASINLLMGIVILVYAYSVQQRVVFAFGLFAVLAGLGYHVHYVMEVFNLGSWVSLSLMGITAIFVASILERYGQVIRLQLVNWQYRFQSWEY
jgi:hypothetical protein